MKTTFQCVSLALLTFITACGSASMEELKQSATSAFLSGDYDAALALADDALAVAKQAGADKVAQWDLEDLRLKALAASGDSVDTVLDTLDRLGEEYAAKIDVDRYIAVAHAIKDKTVDGAISVILQAMEYFPEAKERLDEAFVDLLDFAQVKDDASLAKGRSRGCCDF